MADSQQIEKSNAAVNDETDEDASAAQAQIIASLRAQVTDLFSQVTQLNSKLVASYDRVSGLEDQLHDTSSSLRNASVTISSLELERSHHLAALNTGLLVEKAHVTAELNRLMERATEEAAQRGQAESARHDIEKDLDDLSATLFHQANTMVAEARLNQARSQRKLYDAVQALRIAEDAVKDMQVQMQSLQAEKEAAERDVHEAKVTMGKGKWAEREDLRVGEVPRVRFMITHTPYAEFTAFVSHLRGLRASQPAPPVISTLLNQPFLARLLTEDSEPTVRLDLAPSLNWLSRRSVLAAIHTGMLTVEPLPFSSLVQELHQHPQSMTTSSLSCALCGTHIARLPSTTPISRSQSTNGGSWFKYPLALGNAQNHNATARSPDCEPPGQVYVFRLAVATGSTSPSVPAPLHISSASMSAVGNSSRPPPLNSITSSRVLQVQTQNVPHPLCTSNYCLTRLRSTCTLWAFVRVGVVERIWEEEIVQVPKSVTNDDAHRAISPLAITGTGNQHANGAPSSPAFEKPPVPPRRRKLWEMASALGERAVSWGKETGENSREKEKEKQREKESDSAKQLLTPPPSHPSAPHPHSESPTSRVPPPLPKRKNVHDVTTTDTAFASSATQNGVGTPETKESTPSAEGPNDVDKTELDKSTSSTPIDDVTFVPPTSEDSSPPLATPPPVAAELTAPPVQDEARPPSPNSIPLPTTPSPVPRVTSPAPRPRSRVSSPASPPPSSRPGSPAISHSRAGSPAPSGVVRATPSSPGHPFSVSNLRGKTSMSSPLAPSRSASPAPATGPGAPPLPRRAAARRPVPLLPLPPSTSEGPKVVENGTKDEEKAYVASSECLEGTEEKVKDIEETTSAVAATTIDPIPDSDSPKASEVEVLGLGDEKEREGTVDVVKESSAPQAVPVSAPEIEAAPEPAKDVAVDEVIGTNGHAEGAVNGASATADPLPAPRAPESDGDASVDTTSTKQSSSTEWEGFATDGTWEERTWKELVRLKEAMFWARIGGIRALEG